LFERFTHAGEFSVYRSRSQLMINIR
jgi:hypothetical protein